MCTLYDQHRTYICTVYIFLAPFFLPQCFVLIKHFVLYGFFSLMYSRCTTTLHLRKTATCSLLKFRFEGSNKYRFLVIGINIRWKPQNLPFLGPCQNDLGHSLIDLYRKKLKFNPQKYDRLIFSRLNENMIWKRIERLLGTKVLA